jgi:hypothetical protein
MTGMRQRYRRNAAALVSAIAVLLVVAGFAAVILSVHGAHVSTAESAVCRLRAEAAAMGATQLTLWSLRQDADQQADIARVVSAHDTSFQATPLFQVDGDLAGATFHVDLWPGEDTVRLKTVAQCGGVYFQRWAQMSIRLDSGSNLVTGGDFEDSGVINGLPVWRGAASVGQWLAGYGLMRIDDREHWWTPPSWNVTRDDGDHFAENLRLSSALAQYVSGQGVKGTLSLEFDYVRDSGNLSVQVRGVNTLPAVGILLPGLPAYRNWSEAGTLLYDSGNLAHADEWNHVEANVDAGGGYKYYVVEIVAVGGNGNLHEAERAIDNVTLRGSR